MNGTDAPFLWALPFDPPNNHLFKVYIFCVLFIFFIYLVLMLIFVFVAEIFFWVKKLLGRGHNGPLEIHYLL